MTFLNMALLSGLVVVAIPIIIHLLNRSRAKVMDWGAMRFLMASLAARNRRIQLEELLLLILRCLILALLVLAMARPFLPSASSVPWPIVLPAVFIAVMLAGLAAMMWHQKRARNIMLACAGVLTLLAAGASLYEHLALNKRWSFRPGEKDIAIVLDASASMTVEQDGRSAFDAARDEARAVIAACRPADTIGLVRGGTVPRMPIAGQTSDRDRLDDALEQMRAGAGTFAVADAVRAAAASLAKGRNAGKKIVIITDGQNLGWNTANEGLWRTIGAELDTLSARPKVLVRLLGTPATFRNVALTELATSRRIIGTDRPVRIDLTVASTGTNATSAAIVELTADGEPVGRRTVQALAPGASELVSFNWRFKQAGMHVLDATIDSDDDLRADNVVRRVVEVAARLPVLLVDGSPSPGKLDGAATFIELALAPSTVKDRETSAAPGASDLVAPTCVDAARLEEDIAFDGYRAVVLADVPKLRATTAARLASYVREGGGLLVAAGEHCDRDFYNAWTDAGELLTPALLGAARTTPPEPTRLALATFTHEVAAMLADPKECPDAASVLVRSFWPLNANDRDPNVRVCGRLRDGEPLLVERTFGKGRVVLSAMGLGINDSNLPALACFVPLTHELVYHLAAPMLPVYNVTPAREVVIDLLMEGRGDDGLKAEYFRGRDLDGQPAVTRVDRVVNFDWTNEGPSPRLGQQDFSVRWTGNVRLPGGKPGNVTFTTTSDDGVRLWVGKKQLINNWTDHAQIDDSGSIYMGADRTYPIRLEYFQGTGNAVCKLSWSVSRGERQLVPATAFAPAQGVPMWIPLAEARARGQNESAVTLDRTGTPVGTARLSGSAPRLRLLIRDVDEPDVYRVMPAGSSDPATGVPFAILNAPEESRIAPMTDEDWRRLGEFMDLFPARTGDDLKTALTGGVPGEELWRYLALAVWFGLLLEIGFTRWIAIGRRSHSAVEVTLDGQAVAGIGRGRDRDRLAASARARAMAGGKS